MLACFLAGNFPGFWVEVTRMTLMKLVSWRLLGALRRCGIMARGLSIDKFIYLLFHTPFTLQSCAIAANCSFATLPLHATESVPFAPSSPVDVMYAVYSLLVSCLVLLLFGFQSDASAVFSRQASGASSSIYNSRFPSVTWDNDLWRVRTTALDQGHFQARQSIANGYFGRLGTPDG